MCSQEQHQSSILIEAEQTHTACTTAEKVSAAVSSKSNTSGQMRKQRFLRVARSGLKNISQKGWDGTNFAE